jgi:branched-chain amino acid transport system substrate-binding protein
MRQKFALMVLILLALGLASCGDDDDTPAAADAGESTTTTEALTGPPIKLAAIVDGTQALEPRREVHAAADAAVAEINADGGINGSPLEIEICDTKLDANSTESCARELTGDDDVVAFVGNFANFAEALNGLLAEKGIASIGNLPVGLGDYTCKVCFPTTSGAIGSMGGAATLIADVLEDRNFNVAIADVPAGKQIPPLLSGILAGRGSKATVDRVVPIPLAQTDMTSVAATATGGDPAAVIGGLGAEQALALIQAASTAGSDVPFVVSTFAVSEADIAKLGAAAEGLYLSSPFPIEGPAVDAFNKAMDAADPELSKNDGAKYMWSAIRVFAEVARGIDGPITRAAVLEAMSTGTNIETDGLTPPLDFTKEFTGFGGALPRIFNTTVVYAQVRDGKITELPGGFHEVFGPKQ